ncbi:protein ABHD8-like [Lytechinus variegatus]|uniref:protein ABHD8-like n=1 Tax=Lytechinus variegatus TaxID=7654 RepID=UPI001BB1BD55|nr:protein ABHD8-like [Lytechinus variegatus]XP_041464784.1 protein ABHD8-like [Lytechinus variegatus]
MRNQPQRQSSSGAFSSLNWRNRAISPGQHNVNILEIRPGRWLRIEYILGKHRQGNDRNSQVGSSGKPNGGPNTRDLSAGSIIMNNEGSEQASNTTSNSLHRENLPSGDNVHTQQNQHYSKWSSQVSLISLMEEPGTVLFFFHGVGGCAEVWYHQLRYFEEAGFEMVVPDMLGHGFSRAPKEMAAYKFEELAEDVLAIFDRYAKKRNVLIGHSYGGSFCTLIAKERSRKVTKVVLISNGGPIPLSPEPCHLFCLPSCCLACIKPIINRTFARQAFHTKDKRSAVDLRNAFDIPAYVLRATMQGQYWPEGGSDYHSSLSVGVLIIHGRQDELVPQKESVTMQETIYASQLEVVESAGHMVMVEQPQKVNELIHSFILKDMTISLAMQQSHVTKHMTNPPDAAAFLPSPIQRHKTVPNFSITS